MLLSLPPKLRSNYSASKTGRGIVFSPRFLSPGKNRNNVGNYTTKEEEPADEGGGEGEGGEGSKPRWYKGERSLDGERSGVVSESVTFTVSRSNLDSYSCCFFCFGQSPGELKENFILQLLERERDVSLSGQEVYEKSRNALWISSLLSHLPLVADIR